MIDFHGRQYLELAEVCEAWSKDKDYILDCMANEALIRYRGDVYPSDWETRGTDCTLKFVEGFFWIHEPSVYAQLRFLTGNNPDPDIANLAVERLTPHYVVIGGKVIHGSHRYNPAGYDYLPVLDGITPGVITLTPGAKVFFWKDTVERIAEKRGILEGIDESSLPLDAVQAMENQRQESFDRWLKKPLWSEAELKDFCCGMFPDLTRTNTAKLNEAGEIIMRAILAKQLPCICPSDATTADRMYGHARFFAPADAIRWAVSTGLFPDFPYTAFSPPVGPAESKTQAPTVGVQVLLPHMTERLEKLFKIMREAWGGYDPSRPAKQTNIADDIDTAFSWKKQKNGDASRNGQALAALIRPDEQRLADKRVAKRGS